MRVFFIYPRLLTSVSIPDLLTKSNLSVHGFNLALKSVTVSVLLERLILELKQDSAFGSFLFAAFIESFTFSMPNVNCVKYSADRLAIIDSVNCT